MKSSIRWVALIASGAAVSLWGCGGSGIKVSISPATAQVNMGGTQTFTATVTGSTNQVVGWTIQEGAAGGTIAATGVYTAPFVAGTYHIVATSDQDQTKTAVAAVTVVAGPPGVTVTVLPATANVAPGAMQTFGATVTGTSNQAVTWAVQEGATGGTVTSGGVYTAPTAAGTYHVVATSVAAPTASGSATVTVSGTQGVTIQITPTPVNVAAGQQQQFTVTVTGTADTTYTLAIQEGATGGSITAAGLYTAPASAGTFHVVATSHADTTKTATAVVTVVTISINPTTATVVGGLTQNFTATVTGPTDTSATFTVLETGGGSILSTGAASCTYTAPSPTTQSTYHVVAASNAAPGATAQATVTVTPPVTVSVTPSFVILAPGAMASFSATVKPGPGTVTWAASAGTIDTSGNFTAPGTGGDVTITASSNGAMGQALARVIPTGGYTVSGSVAYGGTAMGRIYIILSDANGNAVNGTSIAAPGPFTIHGVDVNGSATLTAYMDALGTANYSQTLDPNDFVSPTTVTLPGTATPTLTLNDPMFAAPPAPSIQFIAPGNQGVALVYSQAVDAAGSEVADHYNLYWNTTGNPGPGSSKASLKAGIPVAIVSNSASAPLANGTTYYFALSAVANGKEGALSAVSSPVKVGVPTGGSKVSGTATSSGFTATGPLYVLLLGSDLTGTVAQGTFGLVNTPSGSQAYSVSGVASGYYEVYAFIDMDGDGRIGDADPTNLATLSTTPLTVIGATTANVTLGSGVANPIVTTTHVGPAGQDQYAVTVAVQPNSKLPVLVTLSSGANVVGPIDLPTNGSDGVIGAVIDTGPTAPDAGASATYSYSVTYADLTTATLTAFPAELIAGLPTPTAPGSTGTATPTFTWSAPSPAPTGAWSYLVYVYDSNGNLLWQTQQTNTTTTVVYDSDGNANPATLTSGSTYYWYIVARDSAGDQSYQLSAFTVQ